MASNNDGKTQRNTMIVDGCEYKIYHAGVLAKATPKRVAETLERLRKLEES